MRKSVLKCLSLLITFSLFLSLIVPVSATDRASQAKEFLSSLSESEIIEFLMKRGLQIPSEQPDPYFWADLAKKVVAFVIDNPHAPFSINHSTSRIFAENIRKIVISYCGALTEEPVRYALLKSSKFCSWSDAYLSYNCYAFALGFTSYISPGYKTSHSWTAGTSVGGTVAKVRADLQALGCTNIVTSTSPLAYISGQTLICVRVCSTDYHFMRYISYNGTWRHKPGRTLPLKYNYSPSGGGDWTNEYSKYNVDHAGFLTYSGTIMYIRFTPA